MLITTIIGGATSLTAFAIVIGMIDSRARRAAWLRIATARRELWEWEGELVRAAEGRGCGACEVLRRKTELLDAP